MKGKGAISMSKGKVHEFNAQGSEQAEEAMDEKPGFKRGGKAKKKHEHGGKAEGKAPRHRMDRKPRASGGRSPYSSAESVKGGAEEDDETGKGEEKGAGAETEIPVYKRGGHPHHEGHKKHK